MKSKQSSNFDSGISPLISRLRAGDREALCELYRDYGGALLRIIRGRVNRSEEAEEVLQDTFVKIWRYIDQYDHSKGRFFTWAAQIARRAALDKTKTLKYRQHQGMDAIQPGAERADFGADHAMIADSGLRDTVGKLKDRRRRVIECFYYQNLTQKETSEQLDMPLGSVKTELRNALKDLRKLLAKEKHI